MRKIKFSDVVLPTGALKPSAAIAPYVACVVESATFEGAGPQPDLVCWRLETGCDGLVALGCDGREITWRCTRCDDAGSVVGWEGSAFDGRKGPDALPPDAMELRVPVDELFLLRMLAEEPQLRSAPLGAIAIEAPRGAVPRASVALGAASWAALESDVSAAANEANGGTQRSLDRLVGRIQARLW